MTRDQTAPLFSSRSVEWETPVCFFRRAARLYRLTLDVCATPANAKCPRFYTPADDGLARDWAADAAGGAAWMNPPYGREILKWVAKADAEARKGTPVVALLPARTDTRWWHRWVAPSALVRFVRGRLTFGGARHAAPFPSALVVFDTFAAEGSPCTRSRNPTRD